MRNYSIEHFPGGCLCGAENCRGSVTGWKNLPDERKAAYQGLVAPSLLEIDLELAPSDRLSQGVVATGAGGRRSRSRCVKR
jgi:uncharacterized protein